MKIKCIIFDLDGPLVSSKKWHFEALNLALKEYGCSEITFNEHISTYDGLSTKEKLNLLSKTRGLSRSLHDLIWAKKQCLTENIIKEKVCLNNNLISLFQQLKNEGYLLYIATNSIKDTTITILKNIGIYHLIDRIFTNENVKNVKPSPEIYLRAIIESNTKPKECLILEDSTHGIEAAISSGANVLQIKNIEDTNYTNIKDKIQQIESNYMTGNTFECKNLNVLLLCAGAGSRFEKAGYSFIKPLIEVKGKPMIQMVVDCLNIKANYIYCFQKEPYEKYNLKYLLNLITPNCKVVLVDQLTDGAARTALLASEYINNDNELIIANSDQYIKWNPVDFFYQMRNKEADGGILTFESNHPKWSFVKLNDKNEIIEVAEKVPFSNMATCGIYYYKKGSDFVKYANQMIDKNIRTNNEFYLCPVYSQFIEDNKKILSYKVNKMIGCGTPEDLQNLISQLK